MVEISKKNSVFFEKFAKFATYPQFFDFDQKFSLRRRTTTLSENSTIFQKAEKNASQDRRYTVIWPFSASKKKMEIFLSRFSEKYFFEKFAKFAADPQFFDTKFSLRRRTTAPFGQDPGSNPGLWRPAAAVPPADSTDFAEPQRSGKMSPRHRNKRHLASKWCSVDAAARLPPPAAATRSKSDPEKKIARKITFLLAKTTVFRPPVTPKTTKNRPKSPLSATLKRQNWRPEAKNRNSG